jgi:hypothetical protein
VQGHKRVFYPLTRDNHHSGSGEHPVVTKRSTGHCRSPAFCFSACRNAMPDLGGDWSSACLSDKAGTVWPYFTRDCKSGENRGGIDNFVFFASGVSKDPCQLVLFHSVCNILESVSCLGVCFPLHKPTDNVVLSECHFQRL